MITRIFSAYKQSRCWHPWLLACASTLLASIVVFSALSPAFLPSSTEGSSLAQLTADRNENFLLSQKMPSFLSRAGQPKSEGSALPRPLFDVQEERILCVG